MSPHRKPINLEESYWLCTLDMHVAGLYLTMHGAAQLLSCFPAAGDVGVTPEPKMAYTPLVFTPHNYYTIATQSISLGGKRLVINQVWQHFSCLLRQLSGNC
jgi:hypothetical protein